MEIVEDTVIGGRYRLLAKLGRGGMGAVWRAEHEALRVPVAVKLLLPELVESAEARKRFKREAQAAVDLFLSTKHVVQVLDYGIDRGIPGSERGIPFIAMELLSGEDLAQRLARVGRLEPVALCSVLSQVGRAIALAHARGIVHRDLKPANIFLTQDRDTGQELVKVLDFGIARFESQSLDPSSIETRTGAVLGSPWYMSPEQISGRGSVDKRTDVWALGVIAFEALTGQRPFEAGNVGALAIVICTETPVVPSRVAPVPSGFDAWFFQAVARDPDERFQSMAAAVNALMHACGVVEDRVSVPGGSQLPEAALEGSRRVVVEDTVAVPGGGKPPEGAPDGSAAEQKDTDVHVTGAPSSHSVGPTVEPQRGPRRGVWLVALGAGVLLALVVWWLRSEEAPTPAAREAPALVRAGAEPRGSASAAEIEVAPVVSVTTAAEQHTQTARKRPGTSERGQGVSRGAGTAELSGEADKRRRQLAEQKKLKEAVNKLGLTGLGVAGSGGAAQTANEARRAQAEKQKQAEARKKLGLPEER